MRDRLADRGDSRDLVERLRLVQRLQGRVEDLVAALLKLARIDAGVIKLVHSPVDAAELLRRSVEPLAVAFDIADVALETDVAQGACFIGDITWSVEALENILKNCVEHTPAGGAVRVRVVEDVLACRIHIEDTGPGIADDDLPHIFERFYRGEESAHAASELNPAGVGIGLALAKSLVSAQGGTLTAHNVTDLNLTVDELQAEKLALSDSLADISHQLKTPLTSIAISTELVRDRLADRGDSRDLVERLRLVQRLQGRVVALVTDVAQGACFIGGITRSVEALENILKNCVEHTPAGGAVRVRIVEDVLACRIHIEDTGPGIADDDLPHIFERFYRGEESVHAASELNPAGVGIGLALAKSLVSAQGGTLTAHNATDVQGNVTGAAFDMVFFKSIV